jgi:alkylated DNA nucleotide flippase Atl1
VVNSDGSFGGPSKGAVERRNMVIKEGVPVKDGKVRISDDILY